MSGVKYLVLSMFLGSSALLGNPSEAVAQEPQEVTVLIDNQSYYDMHLYALQGGTRRSLGLVTGLTKRRFALPRRFEGHTVQILAEPIGPQNIYVSDGFYLHGGEELKVSLYTNLSLSWTSVYYRVPTEESSKG